MWSEEGCGTWLATRAQQFSLSGYWNLACHSLLSLLLHLLWPHLTPAAAHLHSVRLSNEICCLLLLLAVSLGKRCDLRLGLLHFLVKQNAQKADSIHGQTRASSSWQPDEWTERQTDACYFWPGNGTCPGWLPACLSVRLAAWLCIYGIGTMLPHKHTDEVVLRHATHTVALALGKLWQQAQPGSPSQPLSQACCLLRLLLLLLPLVDVVFLACRLPSAAATLRISNAQPIALFVALFGTAWFMRASLMRLRDRWPRAAVIATRKNAVPLNELVESWGRGRGRTGLLS